MGPGKRALKTPCDAVGPFLDGALSRASAKAFRLHLPVCPGCRQRLSSALQLVALAGEARGPRVRHAPG
ncbi:MAG TPA: zf-HC2 domain-containing protein [Myxococcaceae bacterium]